MATLSEDEVRQIALLVETLERSTFDFLQVELGDLKVTVGKGDPPADNGGGVAAGRPARQEPRIQAAPASVVPAPVGTPAAPERTSTHAEDGTVAVTAPMLGRFYAKPEPGAAPFVALGTEVNPDSTVALIEVMKVFTAVRAGLKGVVTEICVQDEQLVEYGQVLFRIRPA